ncbi:hypothetical protein H6F67_20710 [Microcoleus sp. FACHB-1515]|uniref:hypothetical protein n=1 Tax=Cyanophyceae TaxID=3028117 RepID=UPI0016842EC4|nr:hypothetical protein [Microcoleus sp. FACHB-1515]MBD2092274.1 hypothetical protein [Microcoleus sp. FACHB-1515]
MTDALRPDELQTVKPLLETEGYGLKAIAALEQQETFADAFYALWTETYGAPPTFGDRVSLWQLTIKRVRQEVCGEDDSFRTKMREYKKSPTSAPLLTGLIVSLVSMSGLPIDPAIATVIVLYVLHIGLDVFCEYTTPPNSSMPPSQNDTL